MRRQLNFSTSEQCTKLFTRDNVTDTEERKKEINMKELTMKTMNYDLEGRKERYPHSRAFYLFDFWVHFK
jgi:hypothetical protein